MTITARFASTCPSCGQAITPGQQVEWQRGSAARHADCTSPQTGAAPSSPSGPRALTVERVGRRSYLRGDTLSVRSLLKSSGCHWDADAKAWWIGSHEEAVALAARASSAPAEQAPSKRITHCLGCGGSLDAYAQQHGYRFCSSDCRIDHRMGGQSGCVNGRWHQGDND